MIIVSQGKTNILNFDNINIIGLALKRRNKG
jgi:hypothetical protein|uniref:Uncharacterized protein n=1 Tax=Myoviridae sp. ctLq07 TaxID=2827681 RepID=A0A8S5TB71_9CAUD|nr:MAG TPA: hypothetical protein [Myoviridae sp. ctLq07]